MRSITSRQQIVVLLVTFLCPLITLLITYNLYTVSVVNQNTASTNQNTLSLYQQSINEAISLIDSSISDLIANNSQIILLRNNPSPVNAHVYAKTIVDNYKRMLISNKLLTGCFLYSSENNIYRTAFKRNIQEEIQIAADTFLRNLIKDDGDNYKQGWFLKEISQKKYMFRILRLDNVYCAVMVDLTTMINYPISGEEPLLLCSTEKGEIITNIHFAEKNQIELTMNSEKNYFFTGHPHKFIVVQGSLKYANLYLNYLMPYEGVWGLLDGIQLLFIVLSFLFVFLIPICYCFFQRLYLAPLDDLMKTMNYVKAGNIDTKIDKRYRIVEFQEVSTTFNKMLNQIKQLKIESYERKIEIQQAKLQYLQIQIRPHFFLNCLKNIYGLAQSKQFIRIQDMIIALSRYWRSAFGDSFTFISIEEEVNNVKNYIELQQISLSMPPQCFIYCDESLKSVLIPPLTILTFVENCVKHATQANITLNIFVKIHFLVGESQDYVNIIISDTGKGFSEEMLKKLNCTNSDLYTGEHIGISNIRHRLMLLYHENVSISFSNQAIGSHVELFLPIKKADKEVKKNDCTDSR